MKNGVFKLVDKIFDPNEILDLICAIFAPEAEARKLKIIFSRMWTLRSPDEPATFPEALAPNGEALPNLLGDERRF